MLPFLALQPLLGNFRRDISEIETSLTPDIPGVRLVSICLGLKNLDKIQLISIFACWRNNAVSQGVPDGIMIWKSMFMFNI